MSAPSTYQPFLIGKFGTGQFSYFQPWQSPDDAFEPFENAYTYRGSIQKRQGYQECGNTGLLRYQNCEVEAGDGGATYDWTTLKHPIIPGTVTITSTIGGVDLTATDTLTTYPSGTLGGTLAGVGGTINYMTGDIHLVATGAIAVNQVITICYTFTNSLFQEAIDTGDGTTTAFSGTLSQIPLVPLSVSITTTTLAGATTITDDGRGNLSGDFLEANSFINYTTGDWNLNFSSAVTNLTTIVATYVPTSFGSPIMGINHWEDESTGNQKMTVEDQQRMAVFNSNTKVFDPVATFSQVFFTVTDPAGVTTGAITLPWTNIAPYSITITDGTSTINDVPGVYPAGGFTSQGNLNPAANSTINYATGAITVNFTAYGAPPNTPVQLTITATLQGNYFTGGDTNFFHFENWKARDDLTAYLYLTNNKDRITLFDGTNLSRPNFPIYNNQIVGIGGTLVEGSLTTALYNGIVTCLDLKVYKNRLLLFRPTINTYNEVTDPGHTTPTGTVIEPQVVRFSSEFYTFGTNTIIPFDFVADISGHGGVTDAPTPDWIICNEFLRDAIVVFFQKSTWLFRFTGSAFSPFRWDKINNSRNSNAPYASIDYDDNVTSMGTKGLIYCDGVNVDRYDHAVVDQYQDIDNDNFVQCGSARDDILNQSWMIYPSVERQTDNDFSDKAIIYNFLEKSFSTYNINLTTLGIANTYQDVTWASFAVGSGLWTAGLTWQQANFNWNKFVAQNLSPQVFGGNQYGYVFILNVTETDNGAHIDCNLQSKRWNPFMSTGERCRFGYIDVYYQINPDVTIQVELFMNNSQSPNLTKMLTMDGPVDDDFAWKRIFVNMQGEFIRMRITTPIINPQTGDEDINNGTFLISGICLWAAPAGRLTPGVYS